VRRGALDGINRAVGTVIGDLITYPVGHIGIGVNIRAISARYPFNGYVERINYLPKALSDADLVSVTGTGSALLSGRACGDPARPVGTMLYNIDFGTLQSCTPAGWLSMSPPACPAGDGCPTPTPCVTPTGATGEVIYNADFGVFQVCTQAGWIGLNSYNP
jgi:hypothetical protein